MSALVSQVNASGLFETIIPLDHPIMVVNRLPVPVRITRKEEPLDFTIFIVTMLVPASVASFKNALLARCRVKILQSQRNAAPSEEGDALEKRITMAWEEAHLLEEVYHRLCKGLGIKVSLAEKLSNKALIAWYTSIAIGEPSTHLPPVLTTQMRQEAIEGIPNPNTLIDSDKDI